MKSYKYFCAVLAVIMLLSALFSACASIENSSQQLEVPFVTISENGLAEWDPIENALGYTYKINGGTEKKHQVYICTA